MKARNRLSVVLVVFAVFGRPLVSGEEKPRIISAPVDLGEERVVVPVPHETNWTIPEKLQVLEANELRFRRQVRTVPEALKELPGIMVQKTAHGQGSPFLRGFTGFRTLLLIDGIRLNNSVFRDGPNQYWNTVDPLSVQALEIVKGPGGVIYGSDAIGGAVNVVTRSAPAYGPGFVPHMKALYRFASAEDSHVGRLELSAGWDNKVGLFGGFSIRDFGDLEGGRDVGVQRRTGYDELNGDTKAELFLNPDNKLVLAYQRVGINNAWRTHKTVYGISWEGTTVGSELRRVLDQERELAYAQLHSRNLDSFVDRVSISLSYARQEEDRDRIRSDGRRDRQGFDVGTLGAWIRAEKETPYGTLSFGCEYYGDWVDSFRKDYKADGTLNKVRIQGPVADDSRYDLVGAYIQNRFVIIEDNLEALLGGRYTYAHARAGAFEDPVSGSKQSLSDDWQDLVGAGQLFWWIDGEKHFLGMLGVSQGFRTPNLSDLTRLDTARSNEIETPSPGLDPEHYVSFEASLQTQYRKWRAKGTYFYYIIQDMIVRTPTGRTIEGDREVTKKNAGDGFLHGVELEGSWNFYRDFSFFGNFTWLEGEVETYPTSDPVKKSEPLSRLMPATANLGLRWEPREKGFWVEGLVTIAGRQDRLSTRDKGDTQRIPPGGTLGYTVLTIRAGWQVTEHVTLSLAVENVTNEDYRIHGSGLNEPGTNAVLTVAVDL